MRKFFDTEHKNHLNKFKLISYLVEKSERKLWIGEREYFLQSRKT